MTEHASERRPSPEVAVQIVIGALVDEAARQHRQAETERVELRRREFEEGQRDDWFAENGTSGPFPDLEFETPDCPICWRSTCYEDGEFYCEVCEVWWPGTGYGSQAKWHGETPTSGGDDR